LLVLEAFVEERFGLPVYKPGTLSLALKRRLDEKTIAVVSVRNSDGQSS
jgi:hypothetical protein